MIVATCTKCKRDIDNKDYDPKINVHGGAIICNVCLGRVTVTPADPAGPQQAFETCLIGGVLDRSGSMGTCLEGTISGFNTFLKEQQKLPGAAKFYLMQFDTEFDILYDWVDLGNAKELNTNIYVPRGYTALLDAIGHGIAYMDKRVATVKGSKKVILFILTDGKENQSKEYTKTAINDLITKKRGEGWEVIFLGANQDAIAEAADYGISQHSTYNFSSSGDSGSRNAMRVMSSSVGSYRVGGQGLADLDSLRDMREDLVKDSLQRTGRDAEYAKKGIADIDAKIKQQEQKAQHKPGKSGA